jgi:hypothetical protein
VRGDAGNADLGSVLPEHRPDDFFAQSFARNAARAVHRAEYVASAVVPYYVSDLPTNRGREPGKAKDFGCADPNNKKG